MWTYLTVVQFLWAEKGGFHCCIMGVEVGHLSRPFECLEVLMTATKEQCWYNTHSPFF